MATLSGTNVISKVVPFDSDDTYATHEDTYGQGGLQSVANEAARLAIHTARRKAGMLVCQLDTGDYYKLESNLTTWTNKGNLSGSGDPYASEIEAQEGTVEDKVMSPLRVAQALIAQLIPGNNMSFTPVPGGLRADASAVGDSDYVFWPSAPTQAGTVYKVWADLMAAIAALPEGTIPSITFRESFTIPSAGMPIDGWDMRLGEWWSPIIATGVTVVTIPDGVIIKNLVEVNNGLLVEAQPTTADGVFTNDLLGGLHIIIESLGSKICNTGTKALINANGQVVWARNNSTNDIPPASTGPLVKMNVADTIMAIMFGESPYTKWEDECFIGGVTGSQLLFIHGVHFTAPTTTGWTGETPVFLNDSQARNLKYDDTIQSPTSGAQNVQDVIDWLKTQIGIIGASAFTDLTDAPSSYTSQAGKSVVVNEAEDGVEFTTNGNFSNLKVSGDTRTIAGVFSSTSNIIATLPNGHGILVNDRVNITANTVALLIETGLVGVSNVSGFEFGTGVLRIEKASSSFPSLVNIQAAFPVDTLISFQTDILTGATAIIKNSSVLGNVTVGDGDNYGDTGYWWLIFDISSTTGFPAIGTYPTFTPVASIDIYQGITGSTNYDDLVVTNSAATTITVAQTIPDSFFTDIDVIKHSRISDTLITDELEAATLKIDGFPIERGLLVPYSGSVNELTPIFYGYDTSNNIVSNNTALSGEIPASDPLFSSITIYDVTSHPEYPNIGVMCYFDSNDSKNYIRTFTYEYNVGYTFGTAFELIGSDTSTASDIYMLFSNSYSIGNILLSSHLVVLGGKSSPSTSVYAGTYTIDNLGAITEVNTWGDTGIVLGAGSLTNFIKAQDLKEISGAANSYSFIVTYDTDRQAVFIYINNILNQIDEHSITGLSNVTFDYLSQSINFLTVKYNASFRIDDGIDTTIPTNAYATLQKFYTGLDRGKISLYHVDTYKGFGKSEFLYNGFVGDFLPSLNNNYFVWPANYQNTEDKNQNIVFELENCIVFYKSYGYVVVLDIATGNLIALDRVGSNTFTKSACYRTSCLINKNVVLLDLGNLAVANRILNNGPFIATSKNSNGEAVIPQSGQYVTTSYSLEIGKEYGLRLIFNGIISIMNIGTKPDFMFKKIGLAVDTNKLYIY